MRPYGFGAASVIQEMTIVLRRHPTRSGQRLSKRRSARSVSSTGLRGSFTKCCWFQDQAAGIKLVLEGEIEEFSRFVVR
jgi:hypothetical protein